MKLVFGSYVVADYTATPRRRGVIQSWPVVALVQKEPLYGAANPALFPRGNVAGQLVVSVHTSYTSYDNAATGLKADQAQVNNQASLVLTPVVTTSTVLYTMAGAVLANVSGKQDGVATQVSFTFEITTIT